jgi:hypothetical protein
LSITLKVAVDVEQKAKMSGLKDIKNLIVLIFIITGCATERTRYSTTAMPPPPVFTAPSDVAGRLGYFEIKTAVIN